MAGAEGGSEGPPSLPGLSLSRRRSDRVDELVDEALGDVGLPDDPFLVVLPDGAAQLVVVHGRAVLADAPQPGHLRRVLDLEDAWQGSGARRVTASPAPPQPPSALPGASGTSPPTFVLVEPADEAPVVVWFQQQLLEELPQVDGLAGAGRVHLAVGPAGVTSCHGKGRVRGGRGRTSLLCTTPGSCMSPLQGTPARCRRVSRAQPRHWVWKLCFLLPALEQGEQLSPALAQPAGVQGVWDRAVRGSWSFPLL